MSIEQSIFTCCRARRETGTTGFGYYSVTEGMDELRRNSPELSMLSNNYSAPRNQELWWSQESDETQRDAEETEAIKKHHPVSFGYRVIETEGVKKAVFTYGKNLGRDIEGFRPGNIMVNTVAADLGDVTAYPFEYFGSPEIFTDYDRSFFVNAPDTPADLLDRPETLHTGGRITQDDVVRFMNEDERRTDLMLSMVQFVLDRSDPDKTSRQVMICDRMENIIYWAAAVSLVFPLEIAKQFSFSTYSFLGSADSSSVSLEDVMLCGVYSSAVNGDEPDPRSTNYDYEFEAERIESALFDFEHDFFTEADMHNNAFMMIVRSAMSGNFEQLDEFKRFIMEKTDCRTIGNDYARGCGCFLIAKMRRQQSLAYLADAHYFAKKYMGADAIRTITGIAYSCSLDKGEMSRYFDDIIELSRSCADGSSEDRKFVYAHCLHFIREAFLSQTLSREEYLSASDSIKSIFEEHRDSFEQAFIGSLDSEVISEQLKTITKKWVLMHLAELLCRDAAASGKDLYSRDCALMLSAVYRAVLSETAERAALISTFAKMFGSLSDSLKLYDLLLAKSANDSEVTDDLMYSLAELAVSSDLGGFREIYGFMSESPFRDQFFTACSDLADSLDSALEMFNDMLETSENYAYYLREMCGRLLDLTENDDCETQINGIYRVFLFAESSDAFGVCGTDLCIEFCNTLYNKGCWYRISDDSAAILRELIEGSGSDHFVADSAAHNIFVMYYITKFAETADESLIPFPADKVGFLDLSLIHEDEYDDVVKEIAHAFARRSIATGSAVDVRYDLFIDVHAQPHPGIIERVAVLWLREIMKAAPKDCRVRLTAHILAIMHVDCSVDFVKMGEELYANKIKSADVIRCFEDSDILRFIKDCGGSEKELQRTASDLASGCEKAKQSGSVLGNLFSRFGRKG
ncbi:hypothetical protein SAMN02910447_00935 [Ruminococcus sp. YE71]|uniref:GAP1-N2 domain-containing protein n=1 Tax=unclassified Ruminococcus TaxID=2608920 RepID=UPI00088C0D84|nr:MULTISPECIES: hypothetical protein [unclassified Ruminococcus]SDA15469.1 hypothetical protein SAMN02910446_00934 [Ruminococcus sp. YE78]SFW22594.1 hypothetical protein SAMN02910447_00935 [Ruminococcus sp. YE71]